MTTIHLDRRDTPAALLAGYSGNKIRLRITDRVSVPIDAGLWQEGSRDTYHAVRPSDGAALAISDSFNSPMSGNRSDRTVTLAPDLAVIRHSTSRGRDMGLTIYIHPAAAAPILPAPADQLTDHEAIVLRATACYKSSYNGRDRYAMAADDHRGELYPTRAAWQTAKESLIARGYLNKAGAITTAGRNADPGRV